MGGMTSLLEDFWKDSASGESASVWKGISAKTLCVYMTFLFINIACSCFFILTSYAHVSSHVAFFRVLVV